MAEFTVTSSQLKAKAEQLRTWNNSLNTKIGELESADASLSSMWEGDAKDAFSRSFKADKAKMTLFKLEIDKYITALLTIAAKYEAAEAKNTMTAASN